MKCPLFHRPKLDEPGIMSYQTGDCLKGECAWWDIITERCAVKEIAVQLRSANAILVRLGQNMTLR